MPKTTLKPARTVRRPTPATKIRAKREKITPQEEVQVRMGLLRELATLVSNLNGIAGMVRKDMERAEAMMTTTGVRRRKGTAQ